MGSCDAVGEMELKREKRKRRRRKVVAEMEADDDPGPLLIEVMEDSYLPRLIGALRRRGKRSGHYNQGGGQGRLRMMEGKDAD